MAGSAAIGNLAVNLSMETAAFTAGATKAQSQMRALSGEARNMARGLGAVGNAGRLSTFHMQNLAFQLNDVFVSLASGQNPMRVFVQQGSQIAQISAQAGVGLGGMARALLALAAPFAGVAAGAGLLASAFLGVKQAADGTDLKAYIDTLGLTDEQIKKLTDTTVTWGDVTQATFDVIAERAGTSSAEISGFFSRAFRGIGDFGKFAVAVLAGGFAALVRVAASAANDIGYAVGKGIAFGVNKALDFLQGLLNGVVTVANKVSGFFKAVGVDFGTLNSVDLSRFHVQVSGNFTNPLKDAQGQLYTTFNAVMGGFDKISARAVELRKADLAAQAAALKSSDAAGKAAKGHEARARAVKHEADELERLRGVIEQVSKDLQESDPIEDTGANADVVSGKIGTAIKAFDAQMDDQAKRAQQMLDYADQFGSAIASVALGTESLKQAFTDMAKSIITDIIRMTVRMLAFRAIAGVFGGGGTDASFSSFESSSGGGSLGVPGFANGGSGVFGGFGGVDRNVLSLNGSPIARVSRGEAFTVGNDNAPPARVVVELRDEMLDAKIATGANVQIVRAAPALRADAMRAIGDRNRRR